MLGVGSPDARLAALGDGVTGLPNMVGAVRPPPAASSAPPIFGNEREGELASAATKFGNDEMAAGRLVEGP
jgi:hypothetical protein